MGGKVFKGTWGLTKTQKADLRKRLKAVDSVIETLARSGVKLKALEQAKLIPKENELDPVTKYWAISKRFPTGYKPVSWIPHWTKVPHPREWKPTIYHYPVDNKVTKSSTYHDFIISFLFNMIIDLISFEI